MKWLLAIASYIAAGLLSAMCLLILVTKFTSGDAKGYLIALAFGGTAFGCFKAGQMLGRSRSRL